MFQRLKHFCIALLTLAAIGSAQATSLPKPFVDAAQNSGSFASNGFATTVSSPYGGSYTMDTSGWSGNSGTIAVTYNNFKLPTGWGFNGYWTYSGSVTNAGILTGTLNGTWTITGLNLGGSTGDLSYKMNVVFANGNANLTMTYTMPAMVIQGYSIPGQTQTVTLSFKQQDMMGLLL
jgi:hypothetical protein